MYSRAISLTSPPIHTKCKFFSTGLVLEFLIRITSFNISFFRLESALFLLEFLYLFIKTSIDSFSFFNCKYLFSLLFVVNLLYSSKLVSIVLYSFSLGLMLYASFINSSLDIKDIKTS